MPRLLPNAGCPVDTVGMLEVWGRRAQAARINREKGLSARGSKLSLAGSRESMDPRPASLYMDTISADIIRGAGQPSPVSTKASSRPGVSLSAAATAAVSCS